MLLVLASPLSASDEEVIASAMSAAPQPVAQHATIMAMEADGTLRVVRQGDNQYTCIPDNPATPGPDPMCADTNAMEWIAAWVEHREPEAGQVGFMYMLAGGTDASNVDPWATAPTESNHWIKTGPHVMVVGADSLLEIYPSGLDPDTSQPYVMWAGTPYAHLMIPVE